LTETNGDENQNFLAISTGLLQDFYCFTVFKKILQDSGITVKAPHRVKHCISPTNSLSIISKEGLRV
jgi:hypothetical protein